MVDPRRLLCSRRGACSLVLAAALAALGAACRCPGDAGDYARWSRGTPRAALDSFILFWRAGLHDLEYKSFSTRFTRSHGLSLFNYSAGRSQLERDMPWLAWFAKAKVVAEEGSGEGAHRFWVQVAGRTVLVNVVREERARIWSGDELLAEGPIDLERAAHVASDGRVRLELAPAQTVRQFEAREVTRVVAESVWMIDDLTEVAQDSLPHSRTP